MTDLSEETTERFPTERSLIMVKPQGVKRGLVGEIIQRFEEKGCKMLAVKFLMGSEAQMIEHYIQHENEDFFPRLIQFMVSGPVVPMVWEGRDMVRVGRNMLGRKALTKSIRGQFGLLPGHGNIIHGSDSVEAATREINLWFEPEEISQWSAANHDWVYESDGVEVNGNANENGEEKKDSSK